MTATATPTTQAVSEWIKIFPKQANETYTSSVTFMKQLTVVAVSTITYLKNAFPEDSYTVETFCGVKLRILKKKCRDDLAQFLSTALTQAFEAFDKKYLHQLALCFYEDECKLENLVEYHIFEYSYNDDRVTLDVHSKNRDNVKQSAKYTFENVREQTIHLVKACVVIMQSCQNELPSSYDVSLRLYYNEDAPAEYQAPGYQSSSDAHDHLQPTLRQAIKLGWVETKHHKLLARSYIKEEMRASHEAIPSQNAPILTNEMELSGSLSSAGGETVLCPCNKRDSRGEVLLTCQYCNTQQHAACFGVLRADAPLQTAHCCSACHDREPTRVPTDRKLVALSSRKRECLCIYRRALEWCSTGRVVEMSTLAEKLRISDESVRKMMKMLREHGVLQQQSDEPDFDINKPQKIITEKLKLVIMKYFNTKEENIVDRLLAETLENLSDPVTEVLSPLEKVTLHNESNFGRVIDNPIIEETVNEDATLKQYREALISNDIEEPVSTKWVTDRKVSKRRITDEDRPVLRAGVRTKRARAMPK